MSKAYQTNQKVNWKWGNGTAEGYIAGVFRESVTKTLQGEEVTRKGSDDNPAYLVRQDDGDEVLKLHSELSAS